MEKGRGVVSLCAWMVVGGDSSRAEERPPTTTSGGGGRTGRCDEQHRGLVVGLESPRRCGALRSRALLFPRGAATAPCGERLSCGAVMLLEDET